VKLSEAMRLGAMLSEQGYGMRAMTGEVRCALGAALNAVHDPVSKKWPSWMGSYQAVREYWPWVYEYETACPAADVCHWRPITPILVLRTITHLNDEHHWTREQIAAWVATMEPVVEAEASPVTRDTGDLAELAGIRRVEA